MPYDYENVLLPEWYDASTIQDVELTALPEIGNELSVEEYKQYRNYLVDTYIANPDYYLTVSACKSQLDIDLITLVRIHSFLEISGFINSKVSTTVILHFISNSFLCRLTLVEEYLILMLIVIQPHR